MIHFSSCGALEPSVFTHNRKNTTLRAVFSFSGNVLTEFACYFTVILYCGVGLSGQKYTYSPFSNVTSPDFADSPSLMVFDR